MKPKNNKGRNDNEKVSRALSAILRHKALEVGLEMDPAGFVKLDDVIGYLKGKGHKVNENIIQEVVDNNDKKRF